MDRRAVITGMGVVSPAGVGQDALWSAISQGRACSRRITRFDPAGFACQIAAEVPEFRAEDFMPHKRASHVERYAQFALAAAKMALADARLDVNAANAERCGSIVGSAFGGLPMFEAEVPVMAKGGPRRVSPFLIPMFLSNLAPGEIAMEHGLKGVNYAVSVACASANNAVGLGLRHLRCGDADVILAGGAEASISPLIMAGFSQAKALAARFNDCPEKASRPFDAGRCGFVMGEGAAIVVLETLEHAQARGATIYAELAGFGATDDAYHITAPNPDAEQVVRAIRLALADAGLTPNDVDYVNAHGTSTGLNDKTETLAIKRAFGDHANRLAISSTKSIVGHLLGAAGAVELAATLLCMKHGLVHPTINYETPDPDCDLDYVPNQARPMPIRAAISTALGFGGHNSVIAVKQFKP